MEALITILIILLFVGFILRHLGKYILLFFAKRMAKRFGMDPNAFSQKGQSPEPSDQPQQVEQVIPDNVGEYVDFEEIK